MGDNYQIILQEPHKSHQHLDLVHARVVSLPTSQASGGGGGVVDAPPVQPCCVVFAAVSRSLGGGGGLFKSRLS